jgi:hypothetical protein
MDGVATEVAQEVGKLFENDDVNSRAGKQEAKDQASWATASDAQRDWRFSDNAEADSI